MKLTIANSVLTALCLISGANAFAPIQRPVPSQRLSVLDRGSSALHVSLPRLDLPGAVTDKMTEFGLKNPNSMNDEEYRSYSGAAIAGTLLFFLLPGALVSGIYNNLGTVAGATAFDLTFSILIGGLAPVYLGLRGDSIGETVREYGFRVLSVAKDATGIDSPRIKLPDAISDVMTGQLDLLNLNSMNEKEYDGVLGAAVTGTLLFFLLPGALLSGTPEVLGEFAGSAALDFLLSASIGGGATIYLSLRDDEIAATINQAGTKLLDVVDDVIGGEPKSLE